MIKICHVTPFYGEQYGGSERYVNTIASYQNEGGFDVKILTTTKFRNKVGWESRNGIEIIRCFSYKNIWNINPISFILPFLMKSDIDIMHIHSHLYFTSNQAIFTGKIRRIPTLIHLHGGVGSLPYQTSLLKKTGKVFYDKTLGKVTLKSADMIASVSLNDLQKIKMMNIVPEEKLIYIPNIVDSTFISQKNESIQDKVFTILYIGDIEPWKGIDFLIRWINQNNCSNFSKKLKFQFIGQGSCSDHLRALERKTRDSSIIVEYLGEKPHEVIPKFLHKAQALILPSYWEGFPTVILEAMLAKVPVIATPVGDIPNILQRGKAGLIFNHNFKSLESTITFIIENPEKVKKMSKIAYNSVINNFTVKNIDKKLHQVYQYLLDIRLNSRQTVH